MARGSLIRIQGWRLGPDQPVRGGAAHLDVTFDGVQVIVRQGSFVSSALPVTISSTEVDAILPSDAPLGDCDLIVNREGRVSRPAPIHVVEASFGAFSQNGKGWGQAVIQRADGQVVDAEHALPPGTRVYVFGTGLGVAEVSDSEVHRAPAKVLPELTVGAQAVTPRWAGRSGKQPGEDAIEFDIPPETQEGCFVPIRVRTGNQLVSNTVSIPVRQGGGRCVEGSDWASLLAHQSGRAGMLALLRVDLLLIPDPKERLRFRMDFGFGDFRDHDSPSLKADPIFMLPPQGACTTFSGQVRLHDLFAPQEALRAGKLLDAGPVISIGSSRRSADVPRANSAKSYAALLGGNSPLPGKPLTPLFFKPGLYRITAPGGEIGAFEANVQVDKEIRWTNRGSTRAVDRKRGVKVEWQPARPDDLVMIAAFNTSNPGDAIAFCACMAAASAKSFSIPPEALANIPASATNAAGLPLNLLLLAEIHGSPPAARITPGLDSLTASWISVTGQTAQFR